MQRLEKYVGRIVRLKQQTYARVAARWRTSLGDDDNCFVVAAIDRQMRRLICYGANRRIAVVPADVVLV